MSNHAQAMVWKHFPQGGSKMLVMIALADIGDDNGRGIWCGNEYLAAKVRMSERQVIRIVKELAADEFIEVIDHEIPGRKVVRDRYRLNMERVTSCPGFIGKKGDIQGKKGDIQGKKGDTKTPESEPAPQIHPEPSKPSYKQGAAPPNDDAPGRPNSKLYDLKSYLQSLEKMANKDAGIHKEINRVNDEIKQLVIASGSKGQLQL